MALQLTPELVASVHRVVPDPGPRPGATYLQEHDYEAIADHILTGHPHAGGFWVFAYGSLIWKPGFPATDELNAQVHGWHRSFCLRLTRWRGTPECPGLMLALDRGGSCRGRAMRLSGDGLRSSLLGLLKREMSAKPSTVNPRWLLARTPSGPLPVLAFTVNRSGSAYAGRLPQPVIAETLARAAGHWGSCAEYLLHTVESLEQHGIRDRSLWRLQQAVAEQIRLAQPRCSSSADGARS
jgi:cation transport protein ChaC